MFIWSFKTSKKELILFIVGLVLFIAAMCYVLWPRGDKETMAAAEAGYSIEAETAEQRAEFLTQFGWEIEPDPVEVREVIIPIQFSDVYINYNEIQKSQGFNLERYRGERVKRWTYRVTNYPGTTDVVYANVLVKDGKVVGGDICSSALDGFMHGFSPEQNADEIAQIMSGGIDPQVEQDRKLDGMIPENSDIPPEEDD